jgi:predicted DsbA family dithiol-disulfide isomerase/uncharacterized membrane protein
MTQTAAPPAAPATPPPAVHPRRRLLHFVVRWLAVVLGLAGAWVSFDLLLLSIGGQATQAWLQAQCGETDPAAGALDCQSVLRSSRAWLGGGRDARPGVGLPWAAVGFAYFLSVGLWYLFVGIPTHSRRAWHLVLLLVMVTGAFHSLSLIYVMGVELRRWCGGCLVTHAINGLLLLLTIIAWPRRADPPGTRPRPGLALAGATTTCGVLVFVAVVLFSQVFTQGQGRLALEGAYKAIVDDPEYVRWRYEREPVRTITLPPDTPWIGPADAPHTLVAFIDFQCPACRLGHQRLAALQARYADRLRIAYRYFPQDGACNERYRDQPGHRLACRAAQAAVAAEQLGGVDGAARYRDVLYERQRDIELDRFVDWAAELGLPRDAFAATLDADVAATRVAADVALGRELGLTAVPTFFLDGRRLEHWRNDRVWETLLGTPTTAPAGPP